jgi:hypothetical protein
MNIEDGTYTAVARQWEFGLTKGGADQVAVQFEIVEGPYKGYTLTWYGYFTDKTTKRTMESLRYCGWRSDDISTLEGMGSLLVQIVVAQEEQTEGKNAGKTYPKVRWVNQLGGGGPIKLEKPMDAGQKKMFAARMRMHAKQVPVVKGGYAAPTESPSRADTETPSGTEDDIPF